MKRKPGHRTPINATLDVDEFNLHHEERQLPAASTHKHKPLQRYLNRSDRKVDAVDMAREIVEPRLVAERKALDRLEPTLSRLGDISVWSGG